MKEREWSDCWIGQGVVTTVRPKDQLCKTIKGCLIKSSNHHRASLFFYAMSLALRSLLIV